MMDELKNNLDVLTGIITEHLKRKEGWKRDYPIDWWFVKNIMVTLDGKCWRIKLVDKPDGFEVFVWHVSSEPCTREGVLGFDA